MGMEAARRASTSAVSRSILALPTVFLVADFLVDDNSQTFAVLFAVTLLCVFPYTLWVVAQLINIEFFALTRRNQAISCLVIAVVGLLGLSVGARNDRFVYCSEFERIGDFQPTNCTPDE